MSLLNQNHNTAYNENASCFNSHDFSTNDQLCVSNYSRLIEYVVDKPKLKHLFDQNAALFSDEAISEIKKVAEANEFTVNTRMDFAVNNTLFGQYSRETDQAALQTLINLFDVYFKAISVDMGNKIMSDVIRNKVLSLLRMKIKIQQNTFNSQSILNPTVSVSTTYKAPDRQLSKIRADITSVINSQFDIVKDDVQEELMTFHAAPTQIELRGPVLDMSIKNVLLLQEMLLERAANMKIATTPFISTFTFK